MSVKCMAAVWEYAEAKGGERLMLLAIADYAKDDGSGAYPSIASLCNKTKFSERNVRYLLRKLEDSGELAIRQGMGPHGANLYHVTLAAWQPRADAEDRGAKIAPAKISGGKIRPRGGQNRVGGGAKSVR